MSVSIYFGSSLKINDSDFEKHLEVIPSFMHPEILRYRDLRDKKKRLLSRLILMQALQETGDIDLLVNWKRDNRNKPFISGWGYFSISYSEDLVVLVKNIQPIGIDIEKNSPVNIEELSHFFSKEEQAYISSQDNSTHAFYSTWVKKEALLKAVGTGITEGLSENNTLENSIIYKNQSWHYTPINISTRFTSFICTNEPIDSYELKPFSNYSVPNR